MKRKIAGFHPDAQSEWVADLECGHSQHVRHNPPWTLRPWVVTAEGRASYIGRELFCSSCEMQNPYRTVGTRQIYSGSVFNVREDEVEFPGGKRSPFAVIEMKSGAAVVALNDADEIHLVREYKYAVGKPSLELPSGATEPGETPLETARRELREEAGLLATDWISLGHVDPFTTQLSGPIYLFLARGLSETDLQPDDGEILELIRKPFAEAFHMVMRGEITHAGSCVAILKTSVSFR